MFYKSDKAVRDLGFQQTPPETALSDAARWFEENGYVAGRPKFGGGS
jgi:hypothetical protein